jgi:hypothetical protein
MPASTKPRRTMRVATIFTGVAACTVGMAGVANAQQIHRASARGIRAANTRAVHPDARLSGSIRFAASCGYRGVTPHYLHFSTNRVVPGGDGYASVTSDCFGYRGLLSSPPNTGIDAECGGNNHGYLDGYNSGLSISYHFGPGTGYHGLYWSHLYVVQITSWTGEDTCGVAPDFGGGGF